MQGVFEKMNENINNLLKNEYFFVKQLNNDYDIKNNKKDNLIYLYRHKKTGKNIAVHINNVINSGVYDVYNVLKMIRHKHIIQVLNVFESDGKLVIIEEYIDGITLENLLHNDADDTFMTMNPLGVKRILLQLCDGLFALHSMGIIHRDINPNNIMITNNGIVKIIDFDISKLYKSGDTKDRIIQGTVGYAPYEQYDIKSTDERSDIFSVGVLANKLLTGEHPAVKLYRKGKLGRLIAKCTDISPDKRFKSADELLNFII